MSTLEATGIATKLPSCNVGKERNPLDPCFAFSKHLLHSYYEWLLNPWMKNF